MEELEHALKEYNMGDAKTIKEILAEVDTDNVIQLLFVNFWIEVVFFISTLHSMAGWEDKLWGVCGDDEERQPGNRPK